MHQKEGFSLVEILVVLVVLAVGLGAGVPAFFDLIASHRMSGTVNDIIGGIHLARSEAIKRRQVVMLCAASGEAPACAAGAGLGDGWLVFVDTDGNGNYDAGGADELIRRGDGLAAANGIRIDASPADALAYVAFDPRGIPEDIAGLGPHVDGLRLCHRGNGRWLRIQPTGHPVLYRQTGDHAPDALGAC